MLDLSLTLPRERVRRVGDLERIEAEVARERLVAWPNGDPFASKAV